MSLSAKLVVVGGEVKTAEITLRLPSTVGRGRGATIMLPHPLVSRQHCELYEANGQLMVRDLGSLNGTFVNSQRITESPLASGELLTIGTVTFRAVYESESQVNPPVGPGPQLKTRVQDTDPNGTLRAPTKSAPPKAVTPKAMPAAAAAKAPVAPAMPAPSATPQTENVEDFDFGEPLMEFDEDDPANAPSPLPQPAAQAGPAAPAPKTPAAKPPEPIEELEEIEEDELELSPPSKSPAQPVVPAKQPGPPADPTSVAEGGEEEEATEDDEDFGDFLKSLGK